MRRARLQGRNFLGDVGTKCFCNRLAVDDRGGHGRVPLSGVIRSTCPGDPGVDALAEYRCVAGDGEDFGT